MTLGLNAKTNPARTISGCRGVLAVQNRLKTVTIMAHGTLHIICGPKPQQNLIAGSVSV